MALNMSSSLDNKYFNQGTMSRAGRASADRFNIIRQISLLKEKKTLKDIFAKESNNSGYNKKDVKKGFDSEEHKDANKTRMTSLGLRIDIKKYFDEKKEQSKEDTLIIKKKPKNKNKSEKNKKISLNKSDTNKTNNKINTKLIMENYNKYNIEKKSMKKNNSSPFYRKIRYKFYNMHLKKLKSEQKKKAKNEKKELIYHPKLEFIYNKLQTGLEWKIVAGRKKLFEDSGHFLDKVYNIDFDNLLEGKHSFISMVKQTQRNDNVFGKDVRNRNVSKFNPDSLSVSPLFKKIKKLSLFPKSPFSRDNFNLKLKKLSLKKIKNLNRIKFDKSLTSTAKMYNSAPDFNRYLGRFNENKHIGQKIQRSNENVYYPNYDSILERPKMLVIYGNQNKKENKTTKNFNTKFKGMSSSDIFSASDAFEKYKLYKPKIVPIFEKMTSRPSNKSLPSFMQGIYNRLASDAMTDKSLKLNNYSNGDNYYDIYKTHYNFFKSKKKEEKEDDDDYYIFNNENEFEESKVNVSEEEKKTNKMKMEINKIIGKMDKLYNDYMNSRY